MTATQAKVIARARLFHFYYDRSVRLWLLYPWDLSRGAVGFTRENLRNMSAERFITHYLESK